MVERDLAEVRLAQSEIESLSQATPIPIRISCPKCGELHVDEGEFATRPHRTHTCQHCGLNWQPSLACTVGVKFLPGCGGAGSGGAP